jgi:hypothetical protein
MSSFLEDFKSEKQMWPCVQMNDYNVNYLKQCVNRKFNK